MKVAEIPMDDPAWTGFVDTHPSAGPFHLPDWASLIADCYRFDAFVLAVADTDGEILAGVPTMAVRSPLGRLRWVSLPFSDSCPLLARADADVREVVEALKGHVLTGPARELEMRTGLPDAEGLYPVDVGYVHRMNLPRDPAELHPHKSQRAGRNRAARMGVDVTRGSAPEDIAKFYRLQELTRRRHGMPVQPRRFFDLIQERLLAHGHGFVSTATLDGVVQASGIYLHHNGTLVAKYFASDPRLPFTGAGHLIEWETMVAACTEGYHTLDVGRTDPGDDGLRRYKTGWGFVESPLAYTHISRLTPRRGHTGVGELPRQLVRHSPLWVGRAIGEVLYRWTA